MAIIKNRFTGEVIAEDENKTIRDLVKENKSDLRWSDLRGSNLRGSDLRGSNLSGSDLRGSNLRGSNLSGSDLRGSDLRGSDLRWSDLRGSNLSGSDLSGSNLSGSNLRGSDLRWSKIEFYQFPSIRLLSSMPLGQLSDDLALELMRRDAYAHPKPELFDEWAKGGSCPYQNEEQFWHFIVNRDLWESGNPTMRDSDLILAICKEKGWGIKGYLTIKEDKNVTFYRGSPPHDAPSEALWTDCETDEEKFNFLISGRAWETGIIAKAIVHEVAMAFHFRAETMKRESPNKPV